MLARGFGSEKCNMVGIAQLVERRIVVPDAEGSSPFTHPTLIKNGVRTSFLVDGIWCNGNTSDFDSGIVGSSPAIPAIFYIRFSSSVGRASAF